MLVVVDYFSRFVEVAILKSTSEEFESFLQAYGVEH